MSEWARAMESLNPRSKCIYDCTAIFWEITTADEASFPSDREENSSSSCGQKKMVRVRGAADMPAERESSKAKERNEDGESGNPQASDFLP